MILASWSWIAPASGQSIHMQEKKRGMKPRASFKMDASKKSEIGWEWAKRPGNDPDTRIGHSLMLLLIPDDGTPIAQMRKVLYGMGLAFPKRTPAEQVCMKMHNSGPVASWPRFVKPKFDKCGSLKSMAENLTSQSVLKVLKEITMKAGPMHG